MAEVTAAPEAPSQPSERAWHELPGTEVAAALDVDPTRGLSSAEAAARLAEHGPNRFAEGEQEARWHAFVRQYYDAMQVVLLVAGVGSIFPLAQYGTGFVLLLLTVFNAVLGLHQEGKAAAAVAALQKMMIVKAKVRREGQLVEIPAEELVPGDIVSIEAGDVVPADGRLLHAATLEVAEAALTGESLPVSKGVDPIAGEDVPLGDRTDMVFMNTNTTRGTGQFVVTATGMNTEVGQVNFTTQVFQAVGLGYGEPAPGLMERKPRPEHEPILSRSLLAWLAVMGVVLGGTTLGVIAWADDVHDTAVARTMGMTTFAIANVFLSFVVKDDLRSVFSGETYADRRLLKATGLSALAILFGTELGIFQRILGTVSLTGREWIVCILVAFSIVVVSELQKAIRRRREQEQASSDPDDAAPARA